MITFHWSHFCKVSTSATGFSVVVSKQKSVKEKNGNTEERHLAKGRTWSMYSQGGLAAGRDASPYVYSRGNMELQGSASRIHPFKLKLPPRHLKIFQNLKGWK